MPPKTLFLDFDGVLHPGQVFMPPGANGPVLTVPRHHPFPDATLFMWNGYLEAIIADAVVEVQIVLSTTWALTFGIERATSYLPASIQQLVIDRTWSDQTVHWRYFRDGLTRSGQIDLYLQEHKEITDWVAIDDEGVSRFLKAKMEHRWVQTDADYGLSEHAVQQQLRDALRRKL